VVGEADALDGVPSSASQAQFSRANGSHDQAGCMGASSNSSV
jgi:hypothetical protein